LYLTLPVILGFPLQPLSKEVAKYSPFPFASILINNLQPDSVANQMPFIRMGYLDIFLQVELQKQKTKIISKEKNDLIVYMVLGIT